MTVNNLHTEGQTWRKIAATADVSPALVHHVAHGRFEHASWDTVRKLSLCLTGVDPGPLTFTLACPTCGNMHVVGDCLGKVGQPVLLAEGEQVVKRGGSPRKRRTAYLRPCLSLDPRTRIAQLNTLLEEAEQELGND